MEISRMFFLVDDSIVGAKVPIKTSQMWPRRPYKGKRNLAEEKKHVWEGWVSIMLPKSNVYTKYIHTNYRYIPKSI